MAPNDRLSLIQGQLGASAAADATRIDGHVIIITGAAQGIGRTTASLLAKQGAKIAIQDIDEAKAKVAVDELTAEGYEACAFTGDILDEAYPKRLVEAVIARWGQVNCLVNSAGFMIDSAIHKMTDTKFDAVMRIHTYVPFRLIHALAPHWMDKANRDMPKSVINISSTSGLHGQLGQINYATAKAGIIGLTKTVAAEWGRYNVRCNAIAYGWIDTRMTRAPDPAEKIIGQMDVISGVPVGAKKFRDTSDIALGRCGTTTDAAGVMLFLASPLSAYVTGTCIECTGGRYM